MKVFIIDDDPITLAVCDRIIKHAHFAEEVVCFKDAAEALCFLTDALNKNVKLLPQIIFLDLNMPGMSGWEFLEKFKTIQFPSLNSPEIFILSSTVDGEDRLKALAYKEVKNFISKPLTIRHLQEIKVS